MQQEHRGSVRQSSSQSSLGLTPFVSHRFTVFYYFCLSVCVCVSLSLSRSRLSFLVRPRGMRDSISISSCVKCSHPSRRPMDHSTMKITPGSSMQTQSAIRVTQKNGGSAVSFFSIRLDADSYVAHSASSVPTHAHLPSCWHALQQKVLPSSALGSCWSMGCLEFNLCTFGFSVLSMYFKP